MDRIGPHDPAGILRFVRFGTATCGAATKLRRFSPPQTIHAKQDLHPKQPRTKRI